MYISDREDEEVDVTPYEDEPDFIDPPSKQGIIQDNDGRHEEPPALEIEAGKALGDDLSTPEVRDA